MNIQYFSSVSHLTLNEQFAILSRTRTREPVHWKAEAGRSLHRGQPGQQFQDSQGCSRRNLPQNKQTKQANKNKNYSAQRWQNLQPKSFGL